MHLSALNPRSYARSPGPLPGPTLHLVVLQHCRKWKVWLLWNPVGPGQPGRMPQPLTWRSSPGLSVGTQEVRLLLRSWDWICHLSIFCFILHYRALTVWGAATYLTKIPASMGIIGASQVAVVVKNLRCPAVQETGEMRVRSLGWESPLKEGNPLPYSCLENPMDRGAWWAMVHRVTKRQT